jgi:hypothetical protein
MITTGAETYGVVLKIQRDGSDIAGALGTVTGSRLQVQLNIVQMQNCNQLI